jgi:S-adenosylmethionine decarboxylase
MDDGPPEVGRFSGRHVLAELDGVPAAILDNTEHLRQLLARTLAAAGATVCQVIAQEFRPQGVTVLAMLAESHASIHTYPEIGAAFVDVFTCGERADRLIAAGLEAGSLRMSTVPRGRPAEVSTGRAV